LDVDNYGDLAEGVIEEEMMEDLRDMLMARQSAQSILRNPEMLENAKQALGVDDEEQLTRMLADRWDSVPAEMKGAFEQSLGPIVDQIIAQQKPALIASLVKQFEKIGGLESADAGEISGDAKKYSQLFAKLGPAYRAGDAETFNSALTEYQQTLAASPPVGLSPGRLSAENIYNGANLFYHAMVIFLVAFLLATFGWVGYAKQFNQASFWLLGLGWFLLVIGLVLRIYISGRPPVTNLYSSALFVTAVFVPLMMLVERMTWSMTISDGDTFTVLLAVLDTQFWLATHVVCVTIGYGTTFAAGALGVAYILGALFTKKLATKAARQEVAHAMYGMVCLALLFSFFGTVLGGLWGDDSWGRLGRFGTRARVCDDSYFWKHHHVVVMERRECFRRWLARLFCFQRQNSAGDFVRGNVPFTGDGDRAGADEVLEQLSRGIVKPLSSAAWADGGPEIMRRSVFSPDPALYMSHGERTWILDRRVGVVECSCVSSRDDDFTIFQSLASLIFSCVTRASISLPGLVDALDAVVV
jgi:hypothetical protein